jgi:hypothetical protein
MEFPIHLGIQERPTPHLIGMHTASKKSINYSPLVPSSSMHLKPLTNTIRSPFTSPIIRRRRPTPVPPCKRNILSQRHVFAISVSQSITNLCRVQAHDAPDLCCRVVDDCATDFKGRWVVLLVGWWG